jgi:O-antigen/teichoic acid export membrane protein
MDHGSPQGTPAGTSPGTATLPPPKLAGARTLLRGVLWNQLGQGLPVLAALVLVPTLIRALGVDRFGILSLAWMLIGYFTLFDLGVSGALTRLVSERIAGRREAEVPPLVWTSLLLTTGMGVLGAVLLASVAPWLARVALHVPPALQRETLQLTWILACSLPVVTGTAALSGVLAAQHRFGVLNAIRIPMGVLTYLAPLLALRFGSGLLPVGLALAIARVLGALAHFAACLAGTPGLAARFSPRRTLVGPILSFGGWMTVSSVVGPVILYLDRFLIGGMLSMAMVAYYSTPYDLTVRFGILASPISSVMFPAFAACFDTDRARAGHLFGWSVRAVAVLLFPLVAACVLFPRELLTLWLGADFAVRSAPVLRLLALGMFLNGMAQVALGFVQSSGRPDLGARLHVLEVPFYVAAAWLLIARAGIVGAAVACLARGLADAIALFLMAGHRLRPYDSGARAALVIGITGTLAIAAGSLLPGLVPRAAYAAVLLGVYVVLVWRHVVLPGRRVLFEAQEARAGR